MTSFAVVRANLAAFFLISSLHIPSEIRFALPILPVVATDPHSYERMQKTNAFDIVFLHMYTLFCRRTCNSLPFPLGAKRFFWRTAVRFELIARLFFKAIGQSF